MTIGESIRALRLKQGLTQKELGDAIGVAEQSIYRYENSISHPTFKILSKLEAFFGVSFGYNPSYDSQVSTILNSKSIDELHLPSGKVSSSYYDLMGRKDNMKHWIDRLTYDEFGKAEQLLTLAGMYAIKQSKDGVQPAKVIDLAERRGSKPKLIIPVVGRSAAGLPMEMVDATDESVAINGETTAQLGDYAVIAVGDSMIDAGIHDGDRCLIRPQEDADNGQIALVAIDGGSTIKKFYKDDDGFRLVPCNPKHEVQQYGPDAPIRVLGLFLTVLEPPLD